MRALVVELAIMTVFVVIAKVQLATSMWLIVLARLITRQQPSIPVH